MYLRSILAVCLIPVSQLLSAESTADVVKDSGIPVEKATRSDDSAFPRDLSNAKKEIPVPQDKRGSVSWWEPSDRELTDLLGVKPRPSKEWDRCPDGIQATLVELTAKSRLPKRNEIGKVSTKTWSGSGWRGERVNQMFKIWSKSPMERLTLSVSDLKAENGAIISSSQLKPSFLRYVIAGNNLYPDVIEEVIQEISVPSQTTRPIWLQVNIPAAAIAGVYTGKLCVYSAGKEAASFELSLEVQDMVLPPPADWGFYLDLWQHPYSIAYYHKVDLWSSEHDELILKYYRMLADAGQKCITTTIMFKPFGGQTHVNFNDMVTRYKEKDGSWRFDFTVFDHVVELAMKAGIKDYIHCYTMSEGANYRDVATGKQTENQELKPNTEEYRAFWRPFLKEFVAHLKKKGWLEKTRIASNEVGDVEALVHFLKKEAPELGFAGAFVRLPTNATVLNEFDDISYDCRGTLRLCKTNGFKPIEERKKRGQITTFYTCWKGAPNQFTHSPPVHSLSVGLASWMYGLDGFLRWAYNWWNEEPLWDSTYRRWGWPAGDAFLVYPGPRSSVRFELLRDGIEMFEQLNILKSVKDNNTESQRIYDEIIAMMEDVRMTCPDDLKGKPLNMKSHMGIRHVDAFAVQKKIQALTKALNK